MIILRKMFTSIFKSVFISEDFTMLLYTTTSVAQTISSGCFTLTFISFFTCRRLKETMNLKGQDLAR